MWRLLKWLVAAMAGAALAIALLWWFGSPWLVDHARRYAERSLTAELGMPVRVDGLEVTLAPPVVAIRDLRLGDGKGAVAVGSATVRLRPRTSLRQLRPVVDLDAKDVWVDVDRFIEPDEDDDEDHWPLIPPFRVRRLGVAGARVRVPYGHDDFMEFTAANVEGEAGVDATGRLGWDGRARTLHVLHRTHDLPLDRGLMRATIDASAFVIGAVEVHGDGVSITGGGSAANGIEHHAHAKVEVGRLRVLLDELGDLGGAIDLDGTMEGHLDEPRSRGRISIGGFTVLGRALGDLSADVGNDGPVLQVSSLALRGHGTEAVGKGLLRFRKHVPFELEVQLPDIAAEEAERIVGDVPLVSFRTGGRAKLSGTFDPLRIDAEGEGVFVPARDGPEARWSARVGFGEDVLAVDGTAEQGEAGSLRVSVRIGPGDVLDGTFDVEVSDTVAVASLFEPANVPAASGALNASGKLSGTTAAPVFSGDVAGESVQAFGVTLDRLEAHFAGEQGRTRLETLSLAIGAASLEGAGAIALNASEQNDWRMEVRNLGSDTIAMLLDRLAGVHVPLWRGTLNGGVAGQGRWPTLLLTSDAVFDGFHLGAEPFDHAAAAVFSTWPEWSARAELVHAGDERVDVRMSGVAFDEIEVSVIGNEWNLRRLRGASLSHTFGTVSVTGELHGNPSSLGGSLAVTAKNLSWKARPLGDITLVAAGDRGEWRVGHKMLNDTLQVSATVRASRPFDFGIDAIWRNSDLGALLVREVPLDARSSGTLRLAGRLADVARVSGEARVDELSIARDRYRIALTRPAAVRVQEGEFSVGSFELEGSGNTHLAVTGSGSTAGEVHVRFDGRGDLALAELLDDRVRSSRGDFDVAVRVDRDAEGTLLLSGKAQLNDAGADFGLPVVVTDTYGRFSFTSDRVEVDQLNGRAGGGWFVIDGGVTPQGPRLTWTITEMSTGAVEWLEHEVSGKGSLAGTWQDLELAGDVEILRALYDKRIGLLDFVPFIKKSFSRPPDRVPPRRRIRLALHVTAPNELFVDNNVARIEMKADVRVEGAADNLRLTGPLEVLSGQVNFRNRTYEVTSGTVEFRPELGLAAYLTVYAETQVKTSDTTYVVYVQIIGTTDDYRVQLSSDDPSLTQTDLFSLLAFGRTTAQLQQSGSGVSVNDLIAVGAGLYEEEAEHGIKSILRVDRVNIESAVSQTTGQYEPRISIGKDITENFSATLSSSFGVESRRGVELDYRLTPGISLLGMWESETQNEAGAFGGGVKFRREFRRLPRFSLWDGDAK